MLFFRQRGTGWAGRTASLTRWLLLFAFLIQLQASAAELDEIRQKFIKGEYTDCIKAAQEEAKDRFSDEAWRHVLIRSLLEVGRYPDALQATQDALRRFPWSIRLKMLAYEVYQQNGQTDEAR